MVSNHANLSVGHLDYSRGSQALLADRTSSPGLSRRGGLLESVPHAWGQPSETELVTRLWPSTYAPR